MNDTKKELQEAFNIIQTQIIETQQNMNILVEMMTEIAGRLIELEEIK